MAGELRDDRQHVTGGGYRVNWLLAGGFSEWATTPLPPEATVIAQDAMYVLCQQLDGTAEWQAWWAHAKRPYLDLSPWVVTDPPARARPVTVAEHEIRYSPLIDVRELLATPAADQPAWVRELLTGMLDRVRFRCDLPPLPTVPQPPRLDRERVALNLLQGVDSSPDWTELARLLPVETAEQTLALWSGHRPGDYRIFLDRYFTDDE